MRSPRVQRGAGGGRARGAREARATLSIRIALALALAAAVAGAALFAPRAMHADEEPPLEYQVKAAFLYHFVQFTTWPASAFPEGETDLILGIVGEDRFGDALAPLEERPVGEKRLTVRKYRDAGDLARAERLHALFVSSSEEARLSRIFALIEKKPILSVGESPRFASRGGVIGFVVRDDRVRFEINPDAAARQELEVSSKLLRLAIIVRDR